MTGAYLGLQIIEVEPGTEIGRYANGEPAIVTDTNCITQGRKVWVTPTVYAEMQRQSRSNSATFENPKP